MNREAINDAYEIFVKGGYKGSIQDFVSLMANSPDALNDAFSEFTSGGYTGNINDFKKLMGVGNQKSSTRSSNVEQESKSSSSESKSESSILESYDFPQIDGVPIYPSTIAVFNGQPITQEDYLSGRILLDKDGRIKPAAEYNEIIKQVQASMRDVTRLKSENQDLYKNSQAELDIYKSSLTEETKSDKLVDKSFLFL